MIRLHAARDAVITVSLNLSLLEVGEKIAKDDEACVQKWIQEGAVTKPSLEQLQAWEANLSKRFSMLIIQPYVLIQELGN